MRVAETTGAGEQKLNRECWSLAFVAVGLTCFSISAAKTNQQREIAGSPAPAVLQGAPPRKSSIISDSDSGSMKPPQETWRVIGGGVMLGTPTSTFSHDVRLKLF